MLIDFAYKELWNYLLSSKFDALFFFKSIRPRALGNMTMDFLYLLWFRRWTQPKRANNSRILKFELSYFPSNFDADFCQIMIFLGYWWTIKNLLFNSKRGLISEPNTNFCIFGRQYIWNSKMWQMSKRPWV